MNTMNDTGVVAGPASGRTSHTHRLRGLAVTGFIANGTMPWFGECARSGRGDLASDAARYITGQTLTVDDGLAIT